MDEAFHRRVREGYLEHLLTLNGVTRQEADEIASRRQQLLSEEFDRVRRDGYRPGPQSLVGIWEGFQGGPEPADDVETGVKVEVLQTLLHQLATIPNNFHLHRKLQRHIEQRQRMAASAALSA